MQLETSITTFHLALTAAGLLIIYFTFVALIAPRFTEIGRYKTKTPWAGLPTGLFPRFRGGARFVTDARAMMSEGYEKYNKLAEPFIVPQFFSEARTMLPADQFAEALNLPDERVDVHPVNDEPIAAQYTIGRDIVHGPHIDIVRRQLTRKLPMLTSHVYNELVLALRDQWPSKAGEWSVVKTYPTVMSIVSRAANRVFSGTELCRSPDFLEHSREYSISVFRAAAFINMFPQFIQPVVAKYFTRDMRRHLAICTDLAVPIIRKRLAAIRSPVKQPSSEVPIDCLQWLLEDCVELAKQDPRQVEESVIVRRLLMLNMVAIHTTSMVTTNVIYDLFNCPQKDEVIAGLREEVGRVLRESGGEWSKNAINSMHRIDSTIRETMRASSMGEGGLRRIVNDPKGITLSGGLHLPFGTRIGASSADIHQDPKYYGDTAMQWDAFRFSRPREEYVKSVAAAPAQDDRLKIVLEQKNQAVVSTSEDFLPFGHGRHACPGRFFATQEMKLLLAHIVVNYEIEFPNGRPEPSPMNGAVMPNEKAEMRVRLLNNE